MHPEIKKALHTYNKQKNLITRNLAEQPAITAIYQLSNSDKFDLEKLFQCFIDHPVNPNRTAYAVYQAIIHELNKTHPWLKQFEQSLVKYDEQKGFIGRYFRNDCQEIQAIRKLSANDRLNTAKIAETFYKVRLTNPNQLDAAAREIIRTLMSYFTPNKSISEDNINDVLSMIACLKTKPALLTHQNFVTLVQHRNKSSLRSFLDALKGSIFLTDKSLALCAQIINEKPRTAYDLEYALRFLNINDLLSENLFTACLNHQNPRLINLACTILTEKSNQLGYSILTSENLLACAQNQESNGVARIITQLFKVCSPTKHLKKLANLKHPTNFSKIFNDLSGANILTETNFRNLTDAPLLAHSDMMDTVWSRLPNHILEQTVLDRIIKLAQEPNPKNAITRYTQALLEEQTERYNTINRELIEQREQREQRVLRDNNRAPVHRHTALNPKQSTHTASVHDSAANAALLLKKLYGKLTSNQLQEIFSEISHSLKGLFESSYQGQKAKKAFDRLTALADEYDHTDAKSGVSNKQLLALCYLAINDHKKRIGQLADAQNLYIEALYEIQRGDNFDDNGKDKSPNENDKPICASGAFNKLIEKLQGIYPGIEIHYINRKTASNKLQAVTLLTAKKYLKQHPEKIKLLQQSDNSVEVIWNDIQPIIYHKLSQEFYKPFINDKRQRIFHTEDSFRSFVANGMWACLSDDDLKDIKNASMIATTSTQGLFSKSEDEIEEKEAKKLKGSVSL